MQLADASFASTVLGWLATFLIHSTLWIGGAWLVARRVDSATWRERLWRGSIAGGLATSLLVLALPTSSFGSRWEMPARSVDSPSSDDAQSSTAPQSQDVMPSSQDVVLSSQDLVPRSHQSVPPQGIGPDPRSAVETPTNVNPREQVPSADLAWPTLQTALLGLWVAGAAIGLAQLAWAHARLTRVLRSRRPLEAGSTTAALERIASLAGLRVSPRLSTSTALASPIALARGEIVVPERALQRLDAPELESLLGHELAHLARRDPWWLLTLNILRRILWLQPLLSLATARTIEAAELRCDELSARWTHGELALARCLAEVATWLDGRPPSRLVAGMAEHPSALVERVERLLAPRRAARAQGIRVVMWFGSMVSVLACAGPQVEPKDPASTTTEKPAAPAEGSSKPRSLAEERELLIEDITDYLHNQQDDPAAATPGPAPSVPSRISQVPAERLDEAVTRLNALLSEDAELERRRDMADVSKVEALVGASLHVTRGEQDGQPTLTATPHVLNLHADGSIDCSGTQLVAPGSSDDSALKQHLESIAAAMPASRPNRALPPFPYGPLVVRADASTSHAHLYRVLQLNAGPDVGIRTLDVGIAGGTSVPFESAGEPVEEGLPLPDGIRISIFAHKDPGASAAFLDGRRLSYMFGRIQSSNDRTTLISGGIVPSFEGIEALGAKLREIHDDDTRRLPVTLDAAPEVLCSELLAVGQVARDVGFERIVLAVAPKEH